MRPYARLGGAGVRPVVMAGCAGVRPGVKEHSSLYSSSADSDASLSPSSSLLSERPTRLLRRSLDRMSLRLALWAGDSSNPALFATPLASLDGVRVYAPRSDLGEPGAHRRNRDAADSL